MSPKPTRMERTKKKVKDGLNINKHNKWLFIFETVLLVGVLDEYLEGLIMSFSLNIYLHIFIVMLFIGILFTALFRFIEPLTKKIITWTVRINQNKILRVLLHVIILTIIYVLYAKVFFATNIGLTVDIGLNLTQ